MKAAFFDRDGTIIKDYPDEQWSYINSPEFLDGSIEALQKVAESGYKIIIITNQYLIGEGFITENNYIEFTSKFLRELNSYDIDILDIFYCHHSRNRGCDCCKPKSGLITQALEKYPEIDLSQSFFCGDSLCDEELAKNINIKFFWSKSITTILQEINKTYVDLGVYS